MTLANSGKHMYTKKTGGEDMALTHEDLQAIGALMDSKLEPIREEMQSIRNSQLKVELEQYPRITAALDGVVGGIEKDKEQDERIVALERKADNYDTRIYAIEASMKKAL